MINRRSFLKQGVAGAAAVMLPSLAAGAHVRPSASDLVLKPFPVPSAPELGFVYAADANEDPFKSAIAVTRDGIVAPAELLEKPFSVNARWFVEGFGYLWLSADNGGRYFSRETLRDNGPLNLNVEFARARVARNAGVRGRYEKEGTRFSPEVNRLLDLSAELLDRAMHLSPTDEKAARAADRSLYYALWGGEKLELEKARDDIRRRTAPHPVWFGCESRQMIWAKSEEWQKRFRELFNFATITHYVWDSWYELFEPAEGAYNWGIKDDILHYLEQNRITVEGRPLFWFSRSVTPDWLKEKSYDQLKQYMEKHVHDLVGHYGDRVRQWEVFNEYHDWANLFNHTPEQTTELTRFALERTRAENPGVVRLLNNCFPFGEYVARGRMNRVDAPRKLRTVTRYLQDLADAGVDYEVLGIQIYFPQRDLSDIARLLERLSRFGKPVYITEIGASSNLHADSPSGASTAAKEEPFAWHRPWDEELQADWLEQVYTLYYSKPYVQAINWYDFSDFRPYIVNGGLVREDCSTKQAFGRLHDLLQQWHELPPAGAGKP